MTIGETIADPDDPRPLPVTTVDEPALAMTLGINTSPLAGTEGDKLTASALIGASSSRTSKRPLPATGIRAGRGWSSTGTASVAGRQMWMIVPRPTSDSTAM